MSAATLFANPFAYITDPDGNPVVGAELTIFEAGTSTEVEVYTDSDLTVAWAQPITTNSAGMSTGPIFVNPTPSLKIVCVDANGVAVPGYPMDNWTPYVITEQGGAAGGPYSVSVLTSGTAATYTVPAGIFKLWVRLVGAGGGGGGADGDTNQAGCGGGGGGGSYAEKVYNDVTPGEEFSYTIGAGGAAGTAGNNSGTAGGSTIFDIDGTPVTAQGGTGGGSMASGTTALIAGAGVGQGSSGGDINSRGNSRAQPGFRFSGTASQGGYGGGSVFGTGGGGGTNDAVGSVGLDYGAGGGGGAATTTTDRAGGAGTAGVIVIQEFT